MASLRSVDSAIVSEFDIKTSLLVLLHEAAAQAGADATAVLRLNALSRQLEVVATHGFRVPARLGPVPLDGAEAGQVVRDRRPVSGTDLAGWPAAGARALLFLDEGFVGYHGLPLIAKGQVKGVLEVFKRSQTGLDSEQM